MPPSKRAAKRAPPPPEEATTQPPDVVYTPMTPDPPTATVPPELAVENADDIRRGYPQRANPLPLRTRS